MRLINIGAKDIHTIASLVTYSEWGGLSSDVMIAGVVADDCVVINGNHQPGSVPGGFTKARIKQPWGKDIGKDWVVSAGGSAYVGIHTRHGVTVRNLAAAVVYACHRQGIDDVVADGNDVYVVVNGIRRKFMGCSVATDGVWHSATIGITFAFPYAAASQYFGIDVSGVVIGLDEVQIVDRGAMLSDIVDYVRMRGVTVTDDNLTQQEIQAIQARRQMMMSQQWVENAVWI